MATIVLESQKVIEAAEKTIAHIMAEREARDNAAINRRMARKAFSFFRGFYFPTQEEAIKKLDESDCWGWRSIYAWGDLDKAQALLKLAKLGDPVTLNEEDVRILF